MHILIIGSESQEYVLAKHLLSSKNIEKVFVAPGNNNISKITDCVDISTTDISALTEFVKNNNIGLTITFNNEAIAAGVADAFNEANQAIFAPTRDAAKITLSKATCKKFMYKTKILTPRFSVSDKESAAIDYLKNANFPVVIKNDTSAKNELPVICNSFSQAKRNIELKFLVETPKIIIEEFIEGKEYTLYFVTDGYNAVPLIATVPYKYSSSGFGGSLTSGMGAYAPAQMLDFEKIQTIQQNIIYPALREMAKNNNPYIGILGINLIVTPDHNIYTINFSSHIDIPDINVMCKLVKEDFVQIAKAAIIGSLSEDYSEFEISENVCASVVLVSPNYYKTNIKHCVIEGLDNIDDDIDVVFDEVEQNKYLEFETTGYRNLIVTAEAATLNGAREKIYNNVEIIKYFDKKYVSDVGVMTASKW